MPWHITIHAAPSRPLARRGVSLAGRSIQTLDLPSEWLTSPLPVSFDLLLERLASLPRLFIEPDGSFVWIGPNGPDEWTFDGQLHDSAKGLMTVELKVSGDQPAIQHLLSCLDWPATSLVFQLVREGVYLDDQELCRSLGLRLG